MDETVFDQAREYKCEKIFKPKDPNDHMQGQLFVNDRSGSKPVPYSRATHFDLGVEVLCDDYVWFITHMEQPGKIVISKYKVTGDLVYRGKFP